MNPKSDEALVKEIQEGTISAFEHLVRRYEGRLFRFVMRFIKYETVSAEVVQDSFVKLYQMIDRVDTSKKLSTLLFEIAKNGAVSFLREQKRFVRIESLDIFDDENDPYDVLVSKDTRSAVRKAMTKLHEKYEVVLRLYYFDELSYEEIARRLRLPVNTIRTHLRRAKKELKRVLAYEKVN